jgi:ABC-type bacteriocin/lantibiotic exporter with double-glycine peptidase domain
MNKLTQIFKDNWKWIMLSYLLFSISSILQFTYPKVLGDTIDHLVAKDYFYVWHLGLVFVGMMFFGYISRTYDVKVFSSIYRKFASKEVDNQIENGVDSSKINGRLTLMNSIVNFFEVDIATIMQTIYGLVVSIYFISLVSVPIVIGLIISGLLVLGLSYYFSPKIAKITQARNDISEEQTDVVATLKMRFINNLLRKKQKLDIKSVKLNAKYYILIEIIIYASVTALLTYYVMNNNVTIGSVFSTYRYMFDFSNAVIGLNYIIPSFINIKDVIKRLEIEN